MPYEQIMDLYRESYKIQWNNETLNNGGFWIREPWPLLIRKRVCCCLDQNIQSSSHLIITQPSTHTQHNRSLSQQQSATWCWPPLLFFKAGCGAGGFWGEGGPSRWVTLPGHGICSVFHTHADERAHTGDTQTHKLGSNRVLLGSVCHLGSIFPALFQPPAKSKREHFGRALGYKS